MASLKKNMNEKGSRCDSCGRPDDNLKLSDFQPRTLTHWKRVSKYDWIQPNRHEWTPNSFSFWIKKNDGLLCRMPYECRKQFLIRCSVSLTNSIKFVEIERLFRDPCCTTEICPLRSVVRRVHTMASNSFSIVGSIKPRHDSFQCHFWDHFCESE